jgi:UDP-N-acetyl-D-glucosamine dehydrogenase
VTASTDPATGPALQVVVMGQGYVGLPLAMRSVDVGFDVVGYDTDADKVDRLMAADSPVEDISDDTLTEALATHRYRASSKVQDCAGFDYAVITVPTPLRDGAPDLSFIEAACAILADHLSSGSTVVLESTTYPGTTDELVRSILEQGSGLVAGTDFHLGYSPERIDPGNDTWMLHNTPKVISGLTPQCLVAVEGLYSRLVDEVVPVPTTREAELTKLLENTFRHVNIALVNELAMFAQDLDIDIWATIEAASTKPFGFMPFKPGPGVGGHCLPIDPSYLSWQVRQSLGRTFRFVELANDINNHMPDYVVERLIMAFNTRGLAVNGQRVLLAGMAYKRNTGDARESPAHDIAQRLIDLGAVVCAADPHLDPDQFPLGTEQVDAGPEEYALADGVVLLVDHDHFDIAEVVANSSYIFDTRNVVQGPQVEHL